MTNNSRILVALDGVGTDDDVLRWGEKLAPYVAGFKLTDAIDHYGVGICIKIKQFGEVMADVKLFDVPNTMLNRTQLYSMAECTYLTVHAGNTIEALRAASSVAEGCKLIGVTILTSFGEEECASIYYDHGHRHMRITGGNSSFVEQKVRQFALYALAARMSGIVCSAFELPLVRQLSENRLFTITPGIRSSGVDSHDQRRIMTPAQAVARGADRVVMGREFIKYSRNPIDDVKRVNDEIEHALQKAA